MQQKLINEIKRYLSTLGEEALIEAINTLRLTLHEISPFRNEPVDCVLWVQHKEISPSDYSPNNIAPPEKRLLYKSIETDGFTQPIVVTETSAGHYEIVDGFHRHLLGKGKAKLKSRLKGYLPVSFLQCDRHRRISATIRHNRARGRHQIRAMSEIVRELAQLGWPDEKISDELGMDSDEILRLKQINGLQELFANRRFSRAWTVK